MFWEKILDELIFQILSPNFDFVLQRSSLCFQNLYFVRHSLSLVWKFSVQISIFTVIYSIFNPFPIENGHFVTKSQFRTPKSCFSCLHSLTLFSTIQISAEKCLPNCKLNMCLMFQIQNFSTKSVEISILFHPNLFDSLSFVLIVQQGVSKSCFGHMWLNHIINVSAQIYFQSSWSVENLDFPKLVPDVCAQNLDFIYCVCSRRDFVCCNSYF